MNSGLFITAITTYLVAVVFALVCSFFSRHISIRLVNTIIIFHFLVLIFWIINKNEADTLSHPGTSNYLFLSFFISGILVSAVILRKRYPVPARIYFGLFLLSLPVFMAAPGRLLGFAVSGDIHAVNPRKFHLEGNYFLVENQFSTSKNIDGSTYKLVKEMGVFHKTISRNIELPSSTDKVHAVFTEDSIRLTIFFSSIDNKSDTLITIPIRSDDENKNEITRKLK